MNTWAYERQSEPLYGLLAFPSWLDVGGDIRQIEYDVQSVGYQSHKKFMMQADLEVSLEPIPGFRFVTSGGHYGEIPKWERRRYYAMFSNQQETYSTYIRAGRFFPAYGIYVDDHTKILRSGIGFDQGNETFNVEAGVSTEKWILNVARVLGNRPSFSDDGSGGVDHVPNGNDGFTLKLTRLSSKFTQYSLSYLDFKNGDNRRRLGGVSLMTGFTKKLYALAQFDHGQDETIGQAAAPFDVGFARFGYVLFQGFHLRSDLQYNRTIQSEYRSYGLGVQWLPTPHFEFQATYDKTLQSGIPGTSWVLMVHYYI